ncbi:MAG: hypothetical protein ACP5E5_11845 [Acidobacteriaceae bacterium]
MKLYALTVLAAMATATVVFAQSSTGSTTTSTAGTTQSVSTSTSTSKTTRATISERKKNQQERIAQGLAGGKLNAASASKLETEEAGINQEEAGMREQDNGHLTRQDRSTLNQQLTAESKDIYTDKHDGKTQPKASGELTDRMKNQQERIAKGIKSDDLTDRQVAAVEKQETDIHREAAGMRAQDSGKLTAKDKRDLNHQLTEEARRITRDERRTERRK